MMACIPKIVVYIILCISIIIGDLDDKSLGIGKDLAPAPAARRQADYDVIDEKCYEGLGCVQLTPEWFSYHRPVNVLPSERTAVNTLFVRWCMGNQGLNRPWHIGMEVYYKIDSPKSVATTEGVLVFSYYQTFRDPCKKAVGPLQNFVRLYSEILSNGCQISNIKVLIHDFTSNGYAEWIQSLAKAIITHANATQEKSTIVSVQWAPGAEPPFVQAIANARLVALEITSFLKNLEENCHERITDLHLIGHGLGAHIAGYVGKLNKVGKITALDPTGPHFVNMPPNVRLHKDDAQIVEVIHTDICGQGYPGVIGDVDFFPNGGKNQPGCYDVPMKLTAIRRDHLQIGETLPACSHKRSVKYYIESIVHPNCAFLGFACPSFKKFLKGECSACGEKSENCCKLPVERAPKTINNKHGFFFVTSKSPPYCVEILKVLLVLKSIDGKQKSVRGHFNVLIPQPMRNISFFLNENNKFKSLKTDDHHLFFLFRSVPPALVEPINYIRVQFKQAPFQPWQSTPKIVGIMIYKMSENLDDTSPQWFCEGENNTGSQEKLVVDHNLTPCPLFLKRHIFYGLSPKIISKRNHLK